MTTQVSHELTNVEQIFKSLIWDTTVKSGLAALYTSVPFLSVWPLSAIINALANSIGDYLFSGFVLFVDVSAVKLQNDEHQKAYDKASTTLQIIAHNQGILSPAFLQARENAKLALSKFTQFSR